MVQSGLHRIGILVLIGLGFVIYWLLFMAVYLWYWITIVQQWGGWDVDRDN